MDNTTEQAKRPSLAVAGRYCRRLGSRKSHLGLAIPAAVLVAILGAAASSVPRSIVTQKGRAFNPGDLVVSAGDTVQFVNDDGELIHHAYIASPTFSFDSGDQEPGSKTDVVFTTAGKFTVLCGIHPKMHLYVTVN